MLGRHLEQSRLFRALSSLMEGGKVRMSLQDEGMLRVGSYGCLKWISIHGAFVFCQLLSGY